MNCQKHLFSLNEDVHYLNCAYKAPLLKSAEKAATNALIKDRNPFNLKVDDFFSDVNKVKIEFGWIHKHLVLKIALNKNRHIR